MGEIPLSPSPSEMPDPPVKRQGMGSFVHFLKIEDAEKVGEKSAAKLFDRKP